MSIYDPTEPEITAQGQHSIEVRDNQFVATYHIDGIEPKEYFKGPIEAPALLDSATTQIVPKIISALIDHYIEQVTRGKKLNIVESNIHEASASQNGATGEEDVASTPLKDLKLRFGLHDRFDILTPEERYLLSFASQGSGISLQQACKEIALKPEQLRSCFEKLEKEELLVSSNEGSEIYWRLSKAGAEFLKNNPGALYV